jgi:hypothetical protein
VSSKLLHELAVFARDELARAALEARDKKGGVSVFGE